MGVSFYIAILIIGAVVVILITSSTWKWYKDESNWFHTRLDSLRDYNILEKVWPADDKFMSVHFSVLRHLIFGCVSAYLFFEFSSPVFQVVLISINLLYAAQKIPLYNERRKIYNMGSDTEKEIIRPVKRVCFAMVVYAFYVFAILEVLFFIK